MNKKVMLVALSIALVAALVGGVTMAWFTDSDASGPVEFTAGTVLVEASTSMIYGVEAITGDIYEIDVTTGEKYLLFDETIGTKNDKYVNALAFDRKNQWLYYTPQSSKLYFYDFNTEKFAGNLSGSRTAGATFGQGCYWYIPQGSDDLRRVSFNSDGTIEKDEVYFEGFANGAFNFGDIAMDMKGNALYGSASSGGARVYFKINLTANPENAYQQITTGFPNHMQIAFGADGVLYGHATEGTGSSGVARGWYAIDAETGSATALDWSPGERNFNDLASNYQNNWNPGDCDLVRYYARNTGTKNQYVRVKLSGEWLEEQLGASNVTFSLFEGMGTDWEFKDGYFYYKNVLAPGDEVLLCVRVCLSGPDTDDDYQGQTFTVNANVEAIQASHGASQEVWSWSPGY